MTTKRNFLVLASIVLLIWTGCKRNPNQERWDTNILAPLANSTLTLKNLINDTLLKTNADSTISLVYQSSLYNFTLDSLFTIPDTTMTSSYGLTTLNIGNESIVYAVSLGQMLIQGGLGSYAAANGLTVAIPSILMGQIQPVTYPISVDSLFKTMSLISGQMVISIQNQLPIAIYNVIFKLQDSATLATIIIHTFDSIPAHTIRADTESLAGKTINGGMVASISGIWSPGSNNVPVLIDTTNKLTTTISVINILPDSATAIFPAQDLIKKTTLIPINLKGVQLTEIIAQAGNVVVTAYNSLPDTLHFQYSIPGARKNGQIFKVNAALPPSVNGVASYDSVAYDLTGYTIDMKGPNEDTVNTYYFNIVGTIDSTGQIQTLTTSDSIRLTTKFTGLVPYFAKGYLGRDTYQLGPGNVPVNIFNNITGGTLNPANVKLSIDIQNGIGANASLVIDTINAINTKTNNTVRLSGTGVSVPFNIARATQTGNSTNPVNIAYSMLNLDSGNSNSRAIIADFPNQLYYGLKLYIDPQGNVTNFNDFIYNGTSINASLDFEVPLNLIANDLELTDTTAFSIGNAQQSGQIKSGTFSLNVGNGFPIGGYIQMYLLNSYGSVIDSLFSSNAFIAAPIGTNEIVTSTKYSTLTMPISEGRMQNVLNTTKAILKVKFTTQPQTTNPGTNVKIYSNYQMSLKLVGNFVYKVE